MVFRSQNGSCCASNEELDARASYRVQKAG